MDPKPKYTNALVHETSPYLLQHAHNPVNWFAWNDETLEKAKRENKLILVSVGYSACHWCHVMEHESFEDEQVAKLMNEKFICIKVDREERPDIDQVYMSAVQLMTGRGGWPLNCFALPDGRPIYGGTYFPKEQWMNVLHNVAAVYRDEPGKAVEYAMKLTEGVRLSELIEPVEAPEGFTALTLGNCVTNWAKHFDNSEGGPNRAPKFPLPNNYKFLLRYCRQLPEAERGQLPGYLQLTLQKMAFGGIYDQLGGGFARYSTDHLWKVPHFEKMLYDNAQLVSLYSEAWQFTGDPLYKQVVYETLGWVEREMTSPEGIFYSALDADSEGEEGKFYVWTKEELEAELGAGFSLFADYYNVNATGHWEHGNYILLRKQTDAVLAQKHSISEVELQERISGMKTRLLALREKRVRPGLDDKSLTSWNAMMIKGYADAYEAFAEPAFLKAALKCASFILEKQSRPDGGLNHNHKNGRSSINGYLEDYAFMIEALIALYQVTFEEKWLMEAKRLAEYSITHFYDKASGMFWFTSDLDRALIARKMEVSDNVIPASNSVMANALFVLARYFDEPGYHQMAVQMLGNVQRHISQYGSGYSNWAIALLQHVFPFYEIVIVGNSVDEMRKRLGQHYFPNRIFAGSKQTGSLSLLENRYRQGQTLIYVCVNKACQQPVSKAEEALALLK